jgi:hypothetical protein
MNDGELPNIKIKITDRYFQMDQLYDPENTIFIAYGALLVLALIPIYAGSFSSVKKVCIL